MIHFTQDELCFSSIAKIKGLNNTPNEDQKKNLERLVKNVLDPARELLGEPIRVSSGFRSFAVNLEAGGQSTSQHTKGEAADLQCKNQDRLLDILKELPHDQLINESKDIYDELYNIIGTTKWIHVSFSDKNRNQKFCLHNGKVV